MIKAFFEIIDIETSMSTKKYVIKITCKGDTYYVRDELAGQNGWTPTVYSAKKYDSREQARAAMRAIGRLYREGRYEGGR